MEITVLGIDLAKEVFQLHGVNKSGKPVLKKKISRGQFFKFVANLKPCLIGMEACGSAHYWGRQLQKVGHTVKLMSPQFVRPYVKSNKNDATDAEAICEAVSRPNMRFVPIKQIEQQDIQSIHRVRERLVTARTALCNEIRGLLAEYGIVLPKTIAKLKTQLPIVLEESSSQLTSMGFELFKNLLSELIELENKVNFYDEKIKAIHQSHPICQKISKVPGVGPITATAMVAAVGDPHAFKCGRQLSAWLGLVPRQHSSGGKQRLGAISKRGDIYLRKLLIHGARTTLRWSENKNDSRSVWLKALIERRGKNRAIVALANKNVRIIWALMTTEKDYQIERAA